MEVVVEFALVNELGVVGVDGFNFDGDFEVGLGVDGLEDFPEGSLVDLADDFEVLAYLFEHLWHGDNVMYLINYQKN